MLQEARSRQAEGRNASTLAEVTRTLEETRDVLRGYEVTALAGVTATLAEAAESVARTARELHEMRGEEWMDAEVAAPCLKRTPKAFEKVVAKREIPKH